MTGVSRHLRRTCEVCQTIYAPSYLEQRTCSRACGVVIKGHTPGGEAKLSLRDLNAPLTAERLWLKGEAKRKHRDYMRTYVLNQYHTCAATRDRMRNNAARRSAQLRGATHIGKLSLETIATRDNNRCHICKRHVPDNQRSLDHLIPVSLGGEHVAENVALAHRSCNSARGAGRFDTQLLLIG